MADRAAPRVLIAGMGNVLHGDDGFGVEVARRLMTREDLPEQVRVVELGIGGISLVQELLQGYDALVVIDALERDGTPGEVAVLEASVPDLDSLPEATRRDFLADIHYAVPARALVLAKALGVLPPRTWIVGCRSVEVEALEIGLSPIVEPAVEAAEEKVMQMVEQIRRT